MISDTLEVEFKHRHDSDDSDNIGPKAKQQTTAQFT